MSQRRAPKCGHRRRSLSRHQCSQRVAQEPQPSSATRPTSSRNTLAGVACGVGVAIGRSAMGGARVCDPLPFSLLGVGIGLGIAFLFKRFGLSGQAFAIVAALLAFSGCALGDIGAGVSSFRRTRGSAPSSP